MVKCSCIKINKYKLGFPPKSKLKAGEVYQIEMIKINSK